MSWLVTGGAGYIGSHVVRALADAGLEPVVVDDLSSGHERSCRPSVRFVARLDPRRRAAARRARATTTSTGVIHVAGFKYAGVSVTPPAAHLRPERRRARGRCSARCAERGVDKIVFSSSAAVYGTPDVDLVTEDTPKRPESPYGESKLIGEWLLRDQAVAAGLRHTSLRYFNVVGSGDPALYDSSPHNLFPLVFDALLDGRTPGSTATTIRPRTAPACATTSTSPTSPTAHVAAAQRLAAGEPLEPAYNLGSGRRRVGAARSWTPWPTVTGIALHRRGRARAGPATPPASWPPASWPRATSTGGCGTPFPRCSPARGRPASTPADCVELHDRPRSRPKTGPKVATRRGNAGKASTWGSGFMIYDLT